MDVHRISGFIGAEIAGIDLRGAIDEALAADLRAALDEHHVLILRDQHLDLAAQKRLTAVFGPLARLPYVEPMPGEPEVVRVLREAGETGGVFGGDWHADFSFLERPPAGSVLTAHALPPYGGDTLWTSGAAAWETLPEPWRVLLDGRDAIHVGKPYGVRFAPPEREQARGAIRMTRGDPEADRERRHPAVVAHPRTGRRALYLNPIYVTRLDGLTEAESRPVLEAVRQHMIRPEFGMRLRWSPGTVAIWDNLMTLHYATNDYAGHRRLMVRTTFDGPPPARSPARAAG
ncbi:MAG: TauD/TfdA dioxygenase family protein [Paracoccaceae bacterium]